MSDNWTILVPAETGFIPDREDQENAMRTLRMMIPDGGRIEILRTEGIELIDAGTNLEAVRCSECEADIDMDWWSDRMSEDYIPAEDNSLPGSNPRGFLLNAYTLPCCGISVSLDKLVYDWPQAFGRFGLSIQNPGCGPLSDQQISILDDVLKCRLRAVYQHL